jgi:hypothetical protein
MNAFPLLEIEPLSPEANHRIFTSLAREMTRDTSAVDGAELVEDATISYLQPDEPARRNRRPWLLALVAVAAAVLGVGIMVRDNSARTRTNGDVTPETMPIYLPTVLPDGFTFSGGSDSTSRATTPFRDQVYRDPSKPTGARVVQITTSLASTWIDGGHPMDIQGRPAFDASDKDLIAIVLIDGLVSIRIAGRGVSYAEIERMAASAKAASTNPTDGADISSLPVGLKLAIDQHTMPPNRTIDVSYSPEDGVHALNVTILPASIQSLDQWTTTNPHGELTPTTVRGHDALIVVDAEQSTVSLVWPETTGVVIQVSGRNLPAEQVRQTAEGLRRVRPNEWANLLKSKGIAIQDDRAPGSADTSVPATTAATNPSDPAVNPWNLPLLVPKDSTDFGQLRGAHDRTIGATFDGSPRFSQRQVYRETGSAPGSRAVQVEWAYAKLFTTNVPVGAIEGQAPFTEAVPPGKLRPTYIDPNGVFFRLSGRGITQDELRTIANRVTTPWTASWINVGSLPDGFIQAESRDTVSEQYRSTTLDYGSVGIALNPIGSGTIESYAIETPGTFTATKVRGHDGYIVTDPATNTLRLVWTEAPGLLVEVKGTGTDIATLQRVAESLQPVSTDAWKKLLATVGAKPETVKVP